MSLCLMLRFTVPFRRLPLLMTVLFVAGLTLGMAGLSRAGTLVIDGHARDFSVGRWMEEWEDRTGKASLATVMQHRAWQPTAAIEPNKGFTASAWWFRMKVQITDVSSPLWYLMINDAILNQIDAYFVLPSGEIKHHAGGGWVPVTERQVPYRSHVFQLPTGDGREYWIYFRVKSELAVIMPARVVDAKKFIALNTTETWVYSIYFGFMIAMLMFNLVVYFSMRDTANLLYCLFAPGMIFIALTFSGFGKQFFWSDIPRADNLIFSLSVAWTGVTGTYFTERFLFGGHRHVVPYQYLRRIVILLLGIVSAIATLLGDVFIGIQVGVICCVVSITNILVNSVIAVARGNRNANLLIIAWSGIIIGTTIFSFRGFGLLPSNAFTTNILQIASLFECFFLVIALIEKSRTMEAEIDAINQQTMQRLEAEVAQRTQELHAAEKKLKEQQKQKSFSMLTRTLNETFIPSMQAISVACHRSEQSRHTLHRWLSDLVDDEALLHEIDSTVLKVEKTQGLIDEGRHRIDAILHQLASGVLAPSVKGVTPWPSLDSLLRSIPEIVGVRAEIAVRVQSTCVLICDIDALQEILTEVVKNARDALDAGAAEKSTPALRIDACEQEETVTILVIDEGPGMPPEILERVFDPFFTTKPVGAGKGLGLTRARQLLQGCGGSLLIESTVGQGTVCRLSVPKVKHDAHVAAELAFQPASAVVGGQ